VTRRDQLGQSVYARLVEAGAPELPEGRFYRITPHRESETAVVVQLREHDQRGGSKGLSSKVEAWPWTDPETNVPDLLTAVVEACQAVAVEETGRQLAAALIGDHP
jgi:hypothetical protein